MALSRSQVAHILGISEHGVRLLDGDLLHPKKDAKGHYLYEKDEVYRALPVYRGRRAHRPLMRRENREKYGEKAARAMALFRLGTSLADCVMQLRLPPSLVRSWYKLYLAGFSDIERKLIAGQFEKASSDK